MPTSKRCSVSRLWSFGVAFLLAPPRTSASYRHGDVVSMTYRTSQLSGKAEESQVTAWEEVVRSQMPRFGRPGTVRFRPPLPEDGAGSSPAAEEEMAVAFAFSEEQFFLRRVKLSEGGGGGREGGPRPLSRLVIAFTCSAGDIVRVRSDPVYGGGGGDEISPESSDFEVEYRWDTLPEEDEQTGVWLVFAASLVLTIFLAVDTCNGTAGGDGGTTDWDESPVRGAPSLARTRNGEEGVRAGRAGSGGGALRLGGGEERRRRR